MTEYKKPYRGEPSKPFTEEELTNVKRIFEEDMKEYKVQIIDLNMCVPFQRCPICEGTGKLPGDGSSTFVICDVCNGKKIIPMKQL